jgi:hypothetical protein
MTAKVVRHPATSPAAVYPGHAEINRAGATIAWNMLCELERVDCEDDGPNIAEHSDLENWPRQGRPFRNVVAECAARADVAGPEVLEAFYAILSDFIAITCQGMCPAAARYDSFCDDGNEEVQP